VLVLPLLVPRHLDRLQQLLVGLLRLALEVLQVEDPLVHVGEAHRQRVERVVLLEQQLADLAGVVPVQTHDSLPGVQSFSGLTSSIFLPSSVARTTAFISSSASGAVPPPNSAAAPWRRFPSPPALACRTRAAAASTRARCCGVSLSPWAASAFSVCRTSASALLRSSIRRRAVKSARAC